jgi:hypothetical protein
MAKKATKKSASKTTKRKSAPKPKAFGVIDDASAEAALRERHESAVRTAALIAARDTQVEAMIAGSGRNAVRAELAPLHDALGMVRVWSGALVQSIAQLPKLPKSLARGRWREQWADEYGRWWKAIQAARALAGTPVVAAIMDAGEQRPAKKWTSRTVADLDRLAATLHPTREGGSGLGFIRAGAESLPTNFAALADAITARAVELQSVPQSSSPAPEGVVQTESASTDDAMPPAPEGDEEWKPAMFFPLKIRSRLRQATRKDRKSKRVRKRVVDGTILYSLSDARRWWGVELE